MLIYLDSATNRRGAPNENFAREVMELFTLGEGQYSEQDIKQAARAFTGWSIDLETGDFMFRRMLHDGGEKTVFGSAGNFDGDAVLDILLAQPATAEFIVRKLWREFVSPQPDDSARESDRGAVSRERLDIAQPRARAAPAARGHCARRRQRVGQVAGSSWWSASCGNRRDS